MQKTVTLVYSSDTFSRIMHNLSNNDDNDDGKENETRHDTIAGEWWFERIWAGVIIGNV